MYVTTAWKSTVVTCSCRLLPYRIQEHLIESFRHQGPNRLFEDGGRSGVRADQVERTENILSLLAVAEKLKDLDLPSLRLRAPEGERKGFMQ